MIFENSSPKGIFGPNMSDSPNWSLTANSRSLQAAALNKGDRTCLIFEVACPFDIRVKSKQREKSENYRSVMGTDL